MTQADQGTSRRGWPIRSWQFWSGLVAGIGVGLMLGAAFVELELLAPDRKAWVSVLGILAVAAGGVVALRAQRRGGGGA